MSDFVLLFRAYARFENRLSICSCSPDGYPGRYYTVFLVDVYDDEMRKQEKRKIQKELVLYLWATTIEIISLLGCEATRSIMEIYHFMQMQVVKEVVKLFETVVV